MGVSKNNGIPKSSILIGFSTINHPFWGTLIFGTTQIIQDSHPKLGSFGILISNKPTKTTSRNDTLVNRDPSPGIRSLPYHLKLRSCTSGNTWNACVRLASLFWAGWVGCFWVGWRFFFKKTGIWGIYWAYIFEWSEVWERFGIFWTFLLRFVCAISLVLCFMLDSCFLKFPLRKEHLYKLSNYLKMMVLLVLLNCYTIPQCCCLVLWSLQAHAYISYGDL